MKSRSGALLMLLAFTLTLIAAPGVQAENYTPLLKVKVSDIYLTAGEENTIEIELRNTGSYSVYEVEAILTSSTTGIVILDKGHMVFNEIEAEKSKRYRPVIYVDEDISPGPYQLTLTLTYRQMYKLGTAYTRTATLQIGIVVVNSSKPRIGLDISLINPYLIAGEENKIKLSIKNGGDLKLEDIDITITSDSSYIAVLNGSIDLNALEPGEIKEIRISLFISKNIPLEAYTLTSTAIYRDERGESYTDAETLSVVVVNVTKPKVGLEFQLSSPYLTSGEVERVYLKIENRGFETLKDIKVTLTSNTPYIAVLSGVIDIDTLNVGEVVEREVLLAVSKGTPLGVYTLTATAEYRDSRGESHTEVRTLGIDVEEVRVERQTLLLLDGYTLSSPEVYPGGVVELRLRLRCVGAEAYDVRVTLTPDQKGVFSSITSTTLYLGDLDPGEEAEALYMLRVDGGALSGQYLLTTNVAYLDYRGTPRNAVETVTLMVTPLVEFRILTDGEIHVSRGASTTLSGDLLLIGTESVRFVELEIVEDELFKASGSGEYIGALDPDSPLPFDLGFRVSENAEEGLQTLRVRVHYLDYLNCRKSDIVEIPIYVEAPEEIEIVRRRGGIWLWIRWLFGILPR